jgi:hypothetical protein
MPGATASTEYTARFSGPDLIERGRINPLSCPIFLSGSAVTPTSWALEVYDHTGTSRASATGIGTACSYSWTPSTSLPYNEGWRVEWDALIGGVHYVFANDAALVRHRLYPVIDDADLYRRAGALQSTAGDAISTITTYQAWRDEAWVVIQNRLISRGNRPNLILSPSALREVHITLVLALVFEDFASRNDPTYREIGTSYREQYERAWNELNFEKAYADSESATPTSGGRKAAHPTFWLCGRG